MHKLNTGLLFMFLFLFAGCGASNNPNKQILAKINNYEISLDEFNDEFKDSVYSTYGNPQAKNDFLQFLINRKLMIQEAQKENLDKDKEFLKMVERFWEQSLLKLTLDKKMKEIASSVTVSDQEVDQAYKALVRDNKTTKSYQELYKQLKWQLSKEKEAQLVDAWITSLNTKAHIQINSDLLKEIQ